MNAVSQEIIVIKLVYFQCIFVDVKLIAFTYL